MDLANAYPNSAISPWTMAAIALVMLGTLAIWIVMVYVAAREPDKSRVNAGQGNVTLATASAVARDEPGGAGQEHAAHPQEATT